MRVAPHLLVLDLVALWLLFVVTLSGRRPGGHLGSMGTDPGGGPLSPVRFFLVA
jgi:hypothetical protein